MISSDIEQILYDIKNNRSKIADLHGLKLDNWPEELFNLDYIEQLYISQNNLKTIPKDILKLKNLRYLNISNNRLSEIPEYFINMPKLSKLFLSDNCFSTFPTVLLKSKQLKAISLGNNNISALPTDFIKNNCLNYLCLENNKISEIPRIFIEKTNLDEIILDRNPLVSPPIEIAFKGLPSIKNYFESLDEFKDIYKIFEAKLLIVGEGSVGKTCLMNKLINSKSKISDETISTTEGIEINQWYIKTKYAENFRINFWDFGGQEIYHSTHQFFLTKRSLYLFVWTARNDDNITSFDYWLNVIKLLSDNAPVIIVLNKIDERIKMIDELDIQTKFPNVKIFHKVSAKTGEGISELIKIIKSEIEKLPHIGETVPKVWIDIRHHLEESNKESITKNEYLDICRKFSLSEEKALFLSQYFHDLGVFLHFQDNDILESIIFLKPEWATNAVYKVLDNKDIQKKYGKFTRKDLREIWKDYDENNYLQLIELMRKFELCFILNRGIYLAPALFSEKKPTDALKWNNSNNLLFEYHYDFMPSGIITRFIVRTSDLIENNIFWKNGVIINRKEVFKSHGYQASLIQETKAIIEAKPFERKIKIKIEGDNKIFLLGIIRREFDEIHRTLNYPSVREMIPCSCKTCNHSENKYLYDFSIIQKYDANRENFIFCPNGCERVLISSLIAGLVNRSDANRGEGININKIVMHNSTATFADNIKN